MKGRAVTLSDEASSARQAIRVMLADLSESVLRLLSHSIAQQPDMVLVHQPRSGGQQRADLLLAVADGVDVLVLGAPDEFPPPGICSHLWGEFPDLKILVVAQRREASVMYWQGLRRRRLPRVSAGALVAGIRRAHALDGLPRTGEER
jgi:hypothetical protein